MPSPTPAHIVAKPRALTITAPAATPRAPTPPTAKPRAPMPTLPTDCGQAPRAPSTRTARPRAQSSSSTNRSLTVTDTGRGQKGEVKVDGPFDRLDVLTAGKKREVERWIDVVANGKTAVWRPAVRGVVKEERQHHEEVARQTAFTWCFNDNFMSRHPDLAEVVKSVAETSRSRWSVVPPGTRWSGDGYLVSTCKDLVHCLRKVRKVKKFM